MAAIVAAWIASGRGRDGARRALRRAQTPIGDPDDDDWSDDDDWDDDDDDAPDEDDDEEPMQLRGSAPVGSDVRQSVWASRAAAATVPSDSRMRSGSRSTCSLSIIRAL